MYHIDYKINLRQEQVEKVYSYRGNDSGGIEFPWGTFLYPSIVTESTIDPPEPKVGYSVSSLFYGLRFR